MLQGVLLKDLVDKGVLAQHTAPYQSGEINAGDGEKIADGDHRVAVGEMMGVDVGLGHHPGVDQPLQGQHGPGREITSIDDSGRDQGMERSGHVLPEIGALDESGADELVKADRAQGKEAVHIHQPRGPQPGGGQGMGGHHIGAQQGNDGQAGGGEVEIGGGVGRGQIVQGRKTKGEKVTSQHIIGVSAAFLNQGVGVQGGRAHKVGGQEAVFGEMGGGDVKVTRPQESGVDELGKGHQAIGEQVVDGHGLASRGVGGLVAGNQGVFKEIGAQQKGAVDGAGPKERTQGDRHRPALEIPFPQESEGDQPGHGQGGTGQQTADGGRIPMMDLAGGGKGLHHPARQVEGVDIRQGQIGQTGAGELAQIEEIGKGEITLVDQGRKGQAFEQALVDHLFGNEVGLGIGAQGAQVVMIDKTEIDELAQGDRGA